MYYNQLVNPTPEVRPLAYAVISKFLVGAALLAKSGEVYVGCNVENVSLRLTTCAEQRAVASAIASGETDFVAIAVVADTIEPIVPCGAWRQFLAEFAPDLIIVSATLRGGQEVENLSRPLPAPKRRIRQNVHTP
jgi:cytidine deaminase